MPTLKEARKFTSTLSPKSRQRLALELIGVPSLPQLTWSEIQARASEMAAPGFVGVSKSEFRKRMTAAANGR